MKSKVILILCLFLMICTVLSSEEQTQNPTLVFFVRHVDQPENDYVEVSLTIEAKDTSLTKAIKAGASNVEDISSIAKEFCEQYSKKKGDRKQIVDAGVFEIEPRYQLIRKSPVFMGFTITHEMTVAVKSVESIGYLVDRVLAKEGVTVNGFKWKASKEHKISEEAIAEGMEEGQGLCQQLGLRLGRVISVEEVHASQAVAVESEQEDEDKDEQNDGQSNQNLSVFKFEVECAQIIKPKKV